MSQLAPRSSARYAAVFREGANTPTAGRLVVGEDRLLLAGRCGEGRVELSVPYADLLTVRIGRYPQERLNGHPALVLDRRNAPSVQIEPLGAGLLHELADLLVTLATQHAGSEEEVAVIVPLKPGCVERAKALVAKGPPFDPASLGLRRHEVFVTSREAVFVFVGPQVREKLERATRSPALWSVGLAWRACIAGRPRLSSPLEALPAGAADPVFSWAADEEQWRVR